MSKKLYYAPAVAVEYIGADGKDFAASLARPKPMLNCGDIVITDNRTAYNLINKGFGQYKSVESIEIPDMDKLLAENKHLNNERERLNNECEHLNNECEHLKGELAKALEFLSDDETTIEEVVIPETGSDETTTEEVVIPETGSEETPVADKTVKPKIPRVKK